MKELTFEDRQKQVKATLRKQIKNHDIKTINFNFQPNEDGDIVFTVKMKPNDHDLALVAKFA